MKNKWVKFLSAPYILWAAAFIIIPLLMVFYYGLTDRAGKFTFGNITAIAQPEHFKSLYLAFFLALWTFLRVYLGTLLPQPIRWHGRAYRVGRGGVVLGEEEL